MTYKHGIKVEAEKETLLLYKPLTTIHHLNKRKSEIPKKKKLTKRSIHSKVWVLVLA